MRRAFLALLFAALTLLLWGVRMAAPTAADTGKSDVRNTKHNLSVTGPGDVKATTESQVCVFCHTPHGATPGATPLWNREVKSAYTPYSSPSLDAGFIQSELEQPGGSSKLCLSCHDGTMALGSVNVLEGMGSSVLPGQVKINMNDKAGPGGTMPVGSGVLTGFTRNLGTDLSNDHPISVSYTNALALRDGELRVVNENQQWPANGSVIGVRGPGYRPAAPLEPTGAGGTGQIQCATCHDPHRRELDANKGNQKFLRQNRFQEDWPTKDHNAANDIICLSCHDKNGPAGSYAYSAHANPQVATQTYVPGTATDKREFPANLPVWKASCLNCHDAHTIQGARRLLREGATAAGGGSAVEETCFQCHTTSTAAVITTTNVPNIWTDYNLGKHMPLRSGEQAAGEERHNIAGNFSDTYIDCSLPNNGCGKDFIEPRERLGAGNLTNRHAECTDCHNPHRVVKFRSFFGAAGVLSGTPDPAGTHTHEAGTRHSNVASGVLRGAWGVEPSYGLASFFALPSSWTVKRGDPGSSVDTTAGAPHVTREYQVCLKCHSDYGYSDDNVYPSGENRPLLGPPGTSSGATARTNYTRYTNQAREFQAPIGHRAEGTSADSGGAAGTFATNNHRSWHPVIDSTGRTPGVRGGLSADNWRAPFNTGVGDQTMYCTDCHGSSVTSTTSVVPDGGENGNPWGPHGSGNNFILKGTWDTNSGDGDANTLCFKCHQSSIYAPTSGGGARTGFWTTDKSKDGHYIHSARDRMGKMRCNWCHVAVPHGWKNKALLVNLMDVGPEAGRVEGTTIANSALPFSDGPYYRNAMLKVKSFRTSGTWRQSDCGQTGQDSATWMKDVCKPRAP